MVGKRAPSHANNLSIMHFCVDYVLLLLETFDGESHGVCFSFDCLRVRHFLYTAVKKIAVSVSLFLL